MKRSKSVSPEPQDADNLHSNAKRTKIVPENIKLNRELLDLSDDVLLLIFKYLSVVDLMALRLCCTRLNRLCCDRTLCREVDLSSQRLTAEELEEYEVFLHPVTKFLSIKGKKNNTELAELRLDFLNAVSSKCKRLQELYLENYKISRDLIKITDFPATLEKLTLKGCQVVKTTFDNTSYLCKINEHMPHLMHLTLTNCHWLNSHSLMALSKLPSLKVLRLNSCYGLSEEVAYISLACRYGFKSLEILDLRDTFVGDSVVSSFSHTKNLQEMYLECPEPETQQYRPDSRPQPRGIIHVSMQRQQEQPRIVHQDNHVAVEILQEENFNEFNNLHDQDRSNISDRSICSLGVRASEQNNREVLENNDPIQLINGRARTATNPNLKILVVRNYVGVTNQVLTHFSFHGPSLEYLDVTGTSVTKPAVENLQILRHEINVVSSFDESE